MLWQEKPRNTASCVKEFSEHALCLKVKNRQIENISAYHINHHRRKKSARRILTKSACRIARKAHRLEMSTCIQLFSIDEISSLKCWNQQQSNEAEAMQDQKSKSRSSETMITMEEEREIEFRQRKRDQYQCLYISSVFKANTVVPNRYKLKMSYIANHFTSLLTDLTNCHMPYTWSYKAVAN